MSDSPSMLDLLCPECSKAYIELHITHGSAKLVCPVCECEWEEQ